MSDFPETIRQILLERIKTLELALKPFAKMYEDGKLTSKPRTRELRKAYYVYHEMIDPDNKQKDQQNERT